MINPLITIITVCKNAELTIEKCIKSVISQSNANLEYIIIDGLSADGTLEIINEYKNYITKLVSEPDNGVYDAMNKGVSLAHGDIIGFMNSDDCYVDNVLEDVISFYEGHHPDIICGDCVVVDESGAIKEFWKADTDEYQFFYTMPCHQGMFVKRELFVKNGVFNTEYKVSADYEWFHRCFIKGVKIQHLKKIVCHYRKDGISSQKSDVCADEMHKISGEVDANDKTRFFDLFMAFKKKESLFWTYGESIIFRKLYSLIDLNTIIGNYGLLDKKLSVFGTGHYCSECIQLFKSAGYNIKRIFDNSKDKWGSEFDGIKIQAFEHAPEKDEVIIISSIKYSDEISIQLLNMGLEYNKDFICYYDFRKELINRYVDSMKKASIR